MKSTLFAALAGLLGGALAALLITRSGAPSAAPVVSEQGLSPLAHEAPGGSEVDARAALLDELSLRVAALEVQSADPARTDASVADSSELRAELEALRDELRAALARLDSGAADVSPEQLADQVAAVVETREKQEQIDAYSKYQSDREERLDQDMTFLGEKLGLVGDQSERLRSAILAQYEREAEQLRLWREGTSDELVGELKQQDGLLFDEELSGVLTDEQRSNFWEIVAKGGGK